MTLRRISVIDSFPRTKEEDGTGDSEREYSAKETDGRGKFIEGSSDATSDHRSTKINAQAQEALSPKK